MGSITLIDRLGERTQRGRLRRINLVDNSRISFEVIGAARLGDCWKTVQHVLRISEKLKSSVAIYPWSWDGRLVLPMLQQVQAAIDSTGSIDYIAVDVPPRGRPRDNQFHWKDYPNVPMVDLYTQVDKIEYLPTKVKWKGKDVRFNQLCYQITTPRNVWRGYSREAAAEFLSDFPNLKKVPVGLPLSLEESIKVMSESDFYVGIDSGMTHVARSVGLPVFLNPRKQTDNILYYWHPKGSPSYTLFRYHSELRALLKERLPWVFDGV